jgi:hypothetical protein
MPLGQRTDCGDARYAGIEIPFTSNIADQLEVLLGQVHRKGIRSVMYRVRCADIDSMSKMAAAQSVSSVGDWLTLMHHAPAAHTVQWLRLPGGAADAPAVQAATH